MRKFVILASLLASSIAFAGGFGSVEYSSRDGVNGTADSSATKVTIGTDIASNVKLDVSLRQKTTQSTGLLSDNRLEGGLTVSQPVGPVTAYVRGAMGQKYSTTGDFSYYSVEPGIKYQVYDLLTVKAGYRYRDAFTASNGDQTNTWRLGAEYMLGKNYVAGIGYDRVRGDSQYNAINASIGFKF